MTNYVYVTNEIEVIHKYPKAPKGVEFLRNEHRHIMKIKTAIEVWHNDRDIEFILFKRFINKILLKLNINLKSKSCEMIAEYLSKEIIKKYPGRLLVISVSEDGENGAIYEFN